MEFERYRPIVDDWDAFLAALRRPLPTVIWANTLRISPERLVALMAADGVRLEPLSWHPAAFRLPAGISPGRRWEFLAGLYHVQEEVSLLPVVLLDPQPGERVLDLCAAPGNKTAQIAVAMQNRGTVVANDPNFLRMRAVRQVIERLGLVNVSTIVADGATLPRRVGLFDRVLVDAPCSSEGTTRRRPRAVGEPPDRWWLAKQATQRALLRRAIQLCRPGGRVVYATCTYAPEENEAVVNAVLSELADGQVRLLPARVEGFRGAKGLSEWQDQRFHPDLRRTLRVWPHHNDTSGFFVAVLERRGPAGRTLALAESDEAAKVLGETEDPRPWLEMLAERFGLSSSLFEGYQFLRRGREGIYLLAQDHRPPERPRPDACGLFFLRTNMRYPKLTTAAAMIFGRHATRNVIALDRQQTEAYLARQSLTVTAAQASRCTGRGYVLLRHRGYTLGLGLYEPDRSAGAGRVHSLYPKAWSPGAV